MEFKGVKIDFSGLAALVTAISAAYMLIKGNKLKAKKRKEKEDRHAE